MDTLIGAIGAIFDGLPVWLNAILAVIGAARAVTALTPTPKDDQFIARIYSVLESLALNLADKKNASKPTEPPKS